jgi:type II secretory pathway pseudopilin PulG
MKIKPFLKNKKKLTVVAFFIVVLGLLGGGGLYLAQSKSKEINKTDKNINQEQAINTDQQIQENLQGKENIQSQTKNETVSGSQNSESVAAPAVLDDVSIQAIKSSTGDISLSLYGPQGIYEAEKCLNYQTSQCLSGWGIKLSNQNYSGHGGLPIETIKMSEGSPGYVVYRVVNNKRASASKPIIVDTTSIVDTKTFIGG